jgi:hypothetical protein
VARGLASVPIKLRDAGKSVNNFVGYLALTGPCPATATAQERPRPPSDRQALSTACMKASALAESSRLVIMRWVRDTITTCSVGSMNSAVPVPPHQP